MVDLLMFTGGKSPRICLSHTHTWRQAGSGALARSRMGWVDEMSHLFPFFVAGPFRTA